MIKFDHTKVSFEIVELKTITTALGGSLTYEDKSTTPPTIKRMSVPFAVARAFIKKHKGATKYLNPVLTCVMKYEDLVIELERHPLGSMGKIEEQGVFGTVQWKPVCMTTYENVVIPTIVPKNPEDTVDWFFDGRYAYTFDYDNLDAVIAEASPLSDDKKFRSIDVACIDMRELCAGAGVIQSRRTCVAFVSNDKYVISPPVWTDANHILDSKITCDGATKRFDLINTDFAVNLSFALKSGIDISKHFGYKSIEILRLAKLMIDLHTVNLPNVPKHVKNTYDIGLSFKTVFAWLLGVQGRADTLPTYLIIRALLKHLTKRGVFERSQINHAAILQDGIKMSDIPQLDVKMLIKQFAGDAIAQYVALDQIDQRNGST